MISELCAAVGLDTEVDVALMHAVRTHMQQTPPDDHYELSCLLFVLIALSIPKLSSIQSSQFKATLQGWHHSVLWLFQEIGKKKNIFTLSNNAECSICGLEKYFHRRLFFIKSLKKVMWIVLLTVHNDSSVLFGLCSAHVQHKTSIFEPLGTTNSV